jgi:hypothetical protein
MNVDLTVAVSGGAVAYAEVEKDDGALDAGTGGAFIPGVNAAGTESPSAEGANGPEL